MTITELIAQLEVIFAHDGNLDVFILDKNITGDNLENPFPTVIDITKDTMKQNATMQYYNVGDQIVIL
jgi:hypothetical protein